MATKIDRLIVFGDSMSDIGNKRETGMGRIARLVGAMRTNDVGRFSDSRNWTDLIWEWAGGATLLDTDAATSRELTEKHRTLNQSSRYGTPPSCGFSYANYAEGGAMGASDRFGIGLGTFAQQQAAFVDHLKMQRIGGNTLCLVWFGLNDLVTNGRDKEKMKAVAVEMCTLCEALLKRDANCHFIFANIPNPQGAVRYMGKELTEEVRGFQTGSFEFGYELARQVSIFPEGRASLLDIYTPMEHVNENLTAYGIKKGAQPKGMPVRYGKRKAISSDDFFATTSDEAHPTEAVYKLLAQIWADEIKKSFDLGILRESAEATFEIKTNG
jgi:phospholipase/lecithinase/hemolysin